MARSRSSTVILLPADRPPSLVFKELAQRHSGSEDRKRQEEAEPPENLEEVSTSLRLSGGTDTVQIKELKKP